MAAEDNSERQGGGFLDWRGGAREEPVGDPSRKKLLDQLKTIEKVSKIFLAFILVSIGIYAIAQAQLRVGDIVKGLNCAAKIFGILLGVVVAGGAVGSFLGFLFGIPRLFQQAFATALDGPSPSGERASPIPSAGRRFLSSNTNLEQISDWLTKIIVGIGLVESSKIAPFVKTTAIFFKSKALPDAQGAEVMFGLVIISASVLAFLFAYTETRTRVSILFSDLEMRDALEEARYQSREALNILKEDLFASLYLNPPVSFQRAIPIAERLTAMPAEAKDPRVWVLSAAAQGQRYRWLGKDNGNPKVKAEVRNKALYAVSRVTDLATDPDSFPRVTLRRLFDPEREGSPQSENHLEAFKGDEAFEKLIYGREESQQNQALQGLAASGQSPPPAAGDGGTPS
jgi:hypothetical protein